MPHKKRKIKRNNGIGKKVTKSSLSLASLTITGIFMLGIFYLYLALHLPNVAQLKDIHFQQPLRIYTQDAKLIAEFGEQKRIPVKINKIPRQLINALLDTEDQRFYSHRGVDIIGLTRAVVNLVTTGRKSQGASTITMQVARNFFLNRKKTYARKINEILLALKLEQVFTKQQILDLYLNKIYLGQRAYGVAAAAQVYFGKKLDQLTLQEMAVLAGLPQAPSRDNPITDPEAAKVRRDHVLERMYENRHITKQQYFDAVNAPIVASYHSNPPEVYAPYVAEMVRRAMYKQFGTKAYEQGDKVFTTLDSKLQKDANQTLSAGLIAYDMRHGYRGAETNLGPLPQDGNFSNWQKALKKIPTLNKLEPAIVTAIAPQTINALRKDGSTITINWDGIDWARPELADNNIGAKPKQAADVAKIGDVIRITQDSKGNWRLSQVPQVEGALVSINPSDGAIKALVGGFSYAHSKFNRAVTADRQTGSAFKPFVYSAALDKGFTLASVINDSPVVMEDTGANALWRPQNDTLQFYGPTRLRVALRKSRNLVSVRLLQAIGIPYAIDYLQRFGIPQDDLPNALSLALGSASLSPIQIATGYATFANGGFKIAPYFINKIENQDGTTIFTAKHKIAPDPSSQDAIQAKLIAPQDLDAYNNDPDNAFAPRVITAQNAYLMYNAMQDVIKRGTGRAALVLKRNDLAGKTGTTNEQNDAWFSGFNRDLITTVWVGFDKLASLHEYGAKAALPIWINFMGQALQDKPEHALPQPDGITTVRIDPKTGLLAAAGAKNAIFEIFTQGTEPTETATTSDDSVADIMTQSSTNEDTNNPQTLAPTPNASAPSQPPQPTQEPLF